MNIRPGLMIHFVGWSTRDDFADITERIERAAEWTKENGGLNAAEGEYIQFFIQIQITRAEAEGIPCDVT